MLALPAKRIPSANADMPPMHVGKQFSGDGLLAKKIPSAALDMPWVDDDQCPC